MLRTVFFYFPQNIYFIALSFSVFKLCVFRKLCAKGYGYFECVSYDQMSVCACMYCSDYCSEVHDNCF
jgi:hypothetical protein